MTTNYIYLPFFIILLINLLNPGCSKAQEIEITGGIPIYVDANEPEPVQLAVIDLQRDLKAVFGKSSSVVNKLPESGQAIIVSTGNKYKGRYPAVSEWEAHQVYADNRRIVLNGADTRGTIYAIYTFSEEFLGINPLWVWASQLPAQQDKVVIKEDHITKIDAPSIKYRAWFPNDRDLIVPWQRLSEENYEAFVETMLRLKLNTLEGGIADEVSFKPPFPAGKEATLANKRGLMNTGHHMLIFGSSYNNWDHYWENIKNQEAPEINLKDIQNLKDFWGYHIDLAQKNNLDVIWLVGFRGNRDIPFWEFFPNSPSDDPTRAKIIEKMVDIQINMLKEKTGKKNPSMRLTLYNEMSRLVANGDFHIPEEDSLIHNFVAARRDHFPAEDIRAYDFSNELTGYYMNLQFNSSGSHLAQAEGPWKIEQNFRAVDSLSGGNLIFSVMNAGNVREHVMGLSANADMMWNFNEFDADTFVKKFSEKYFGDQFSDEIANLYHDFFYSYWQQKKGDIPGFERQYLFHDMRYARAAEMLLDDLEEGIYRPNVLEGHPLNDPDKGSVGYFRVVPEDNNAENQVQAMINGTASSITKLEEITSKADKIHSKLREGKIFFDDNLRGKAYFMLHINYMLNNLAKAYREEDRPQERKKFLERSINEVGKARQQLKKANHGRFTDWYENDRLFGIENIENRLIDINKNMNTGAGDYTRSQ